MSTEIVRREDRSVARVEGQMGLEPRNMDELGRFAKMAYESGLFKDLKSMSAAGVKIAAGAEFGIKPIASLRSLHVFQGKVEMSATLILGLCKQAGYRYKVLQSDEQAARLEWYGPDGELLGPPVGFTIEQARKAGLLNKGPWQSYTEDMLWARAVSRGARRYCPEVVHGVYVDGEISQAPRSQPTRTMPQPTPAIYDPANNPEGAAAADAHTEQLADPDQHPGEGWQKANRRLRAVMREAGVSVEEIRACSEHLHGSATSKALPGEQLHTLADAIENKPDEQALANDVNQFRLLLTDSPSETDALELRNDHCDTPWRVIALERALFGGGEG